MPRPKHYIVSNLSAHDKERYDQGWAYGRQVAAHGLTDDFYNQRRGGAWSWGYRDAVAHYQHRARSRGACDADFLPRAPRPTPVAAH